MDIDVYKWQALIGSFLGPFFAVFLSYLMWIFKNWRNNNKKRKENIRIIEITLVQTLNHIGIVIFQFEELIKEINQLIYFEVNNVKNKNQYSMPIINFPAAVDIYFDESILRKRIRSYYLHNKLVRINNFIKVSNKNIQQFRYDFEKLLDRNERIIQMKLMLPKEQRDSYIENLNNFKNMIQEIVDTLKGKYIKSVAEARVYNLKLMKKYVYTLYKYEGKFKYFKNKKEKDKFIGNEESIIRINKLLKVDIEMLLKKMKNKKDNN